MGFQPQNLGEPSTTLHQLAPQGGQEACCLLLLALNSLSQAFFSTVPWGSISSHLDCLPAGLAELSPRMAQEDAL